jgi:hypothetical protein
MGTWLSVEETESDWFDEDSECWHSDSEKRKALSCLLKKGADRGDLLCQVNYGKYLYNAAMNGDGPLSYLDDSIAYFGTGARKGRAWGQWGYGMCLSNGWGIEMDVVEAARYLKLSADQGCLLGMYWYALALASGRGVERDMCKAAEYFKFVCKDPREGGPAEYIGFCHENGLGVPRDLDEAMKWYAIHSFSWRRGGLSWREFKRGVDGKWKGFANKPLFDLIVDFESYGEVRRLGSGRLGFTSVVVKKEKKNRKRKELLCVKHYRVDGWNFHCFSIAVVFDVLLRIRHPCFIKYFGWEFPEEPRSTTEWRVLCEYCEKGSLEDVLKKGRPLTHEMISSVVICLVVGMKFFNSEQLIHICLKPSNILFNGLGYPIISDTLNCEFSFPENERVPVSDKQNERYFCLTEGIGFTCSWESHLWARSLGVYSFGAIVYEMFVCGNESVEEEDGDRNYGDEERRNRRERAESVHSFLGPIIGECLREEWTSRPTFWDLERRMREKKFQIFDDVSDDFTSQYLSYIGCENFGSKWSSSMEGKTSLSNSIRIYSSLD